MAIILRAKNIQTAQWDWIFMISFTEQWVYFLRLPVAEIVMSGVLGILLRPISHKHFGSRWPDSFFDVVTYLLTLRLGNDSVVGVKLLRRLVKSTMVFRAAFGGHVGYSPSTLLRPLILFSSSPPSSPPPQQKHHWVTSLISLRAGEALPGKCGDLGTWGGLGGLKIVLNNTPLNVYWVHVAIEFSLCQ